MGSGKNICIPVYFPFEMISPILLLRNSIAPEGNPFCQQPAAQSLLFRSRHSGKSLKDNRYYRLAAGLILTSIQESV